MSVNRTTCKEFQRAQALLTQFKTCPLLFLRRKNERRTYQNDAS
nr:MAG TPA: hypothetical protein [Caudoviricetes sp.]